MISPARTSHRYASLGVFTVVFSRWQWSNGFPCTSSTAFLLRADLLASRGVIRQSNHKEIGRSQALKNTQAISKKCP